MVSFRNLDYILYSAFDSSKGKIGKIVNKKQQN